LAGKDKGRGELVVSSAQTQTAGYNVVEESKCQRVGATKDIGNSSMMLQKQKREGLELITGVSGWSALLNEKEFCLLPPERDDDRRGRLRKLGRRACATIAMGAVLGCKQSGPCQMRPLSKPGGPERLLRPGPTGTRRWLNCVQGCQVTIPAPSSAQGTLPMP